MGGGTDGGRGGGAFVLTYNRSWRLEKLRYQSPLEARRSFLPPALFAA